MEGTCGNQDVEGSSGGWRDTWTRPLDLALYTTRVRKLADERETFMVRPAPT
jgi:hypothetical protein